MSCFTVYLFTLGLLLVYSSTILVFAGTEPTTIIPTAKMLTAASEIPVAMDVTPNVAEESPTGKNP